MTALVGAHADHLEAQGGLGAAELAHELAREDVAGERPGVVDRELHVQVGLPLRGCQSALEIEAARAAGETRVDCGDGVQVARREAAHLELGHGSGDCHDPSSRTRASTGARALKRGSWRAGQALS